MPVSESLTIEIQGDSSGLSQALDTALANVESLRSSADSAATAAGGIGGRLANVSMAIQPIQLVGQQLARLSLQAQALSHQPISLNVQPALSALQSLMSAIQAVAARLSLLSQMGGGSVRGGMGTRASTASPGAGAAAAAASSSGITSRSDASSAWSPAFTSMGLSTEASQAAASIPTLGYVPTTGRTNVPADSPSSSHFGGAYSSHDLSTSTVNHFGGITIEVRETADINALMRDLRLQGLSTRHRQG